MSENIISTNEMRLRMIDLEYKDLAEQNFKSKLKQIYIEEFGIEIDANIEVFQSSDSDNPKIKESGYDGTAVHFYSEKEGINEVYVISQGTQDTKDWEYNIKAMFAGLDYSQAEATYLFTEEVINRVETKSDLSVIGLSHSLAHNNNTTAHLAYDTFDKIYSVNGAQTNYYQLFEMDRHFRRELRNKFNITISDPDAIYNLDPVKLEAFAKDYYADKGGNIHQIISLDDPLYAVSGTRGFFTLGAVDYIDTNPDYPGLRTIMVDIPDHVIQDFQELAIQYTIASNKGGLEAAIYDILGVDMGLINEIDGIGSVAKLYFTKQSELDTMIRNLNDNIPKLMSNITTITSNADVIFGRLQDAGYITGKQKDVLVTEITKIEKELQGIQTTIKSNVGIRDMGDFFAQLGGDAGSILKIKGHIDAIQESLETLSKDDFLEILHRIGESHSISEILQSISGGNKSYIGTDMVLTARKGKKEIRVNMSAALQMYNQGSAILQEKEFEIEQFSKAIEREMIEAYKNERKKVIQKINDMEASPRLYNNLLSTHGLFPTFTKRITSIRAHEVLYPLEQADLDQELQRLRETAEKARLQIEGYRKAIESLFEEDERIAKQFDLIRGI
ncbi:hypothetical protein CWR48_19120 [Oceanobacillus arenosus]|uniref:DUF6792 domain-containing protein n=1 Tax=Oceanobacillus arenosus TaxID=1229153 RepID=A0A3D8PK15_9BACI|nr:DUF6792 domain-containing protein [Oceanobacillus arenosus]RDW15837.1 hypothetical protein CWR48_19120 [Oceanobacillus arenosus]